MMFDENLARMRTHRTNIHRYRRLLNTKLSDIERQFFERRLQEEQSAIAALTDITFRVHLARKKQRSDIPCGGTPVSDIRMSSFVGKRSSSVTNS